MLAFLYGNLGTIVVALAVIGLAALAVRSMRRDR